MPTDDAVTVPMLTVLALTVPVPLGTRLILPFEFVAKMLLPPMLRLPDAPPPPPPILFINMADVSVILI